MDSEKKAASINITAKEFCTLIQQNSMLLQVFFYTEQEA